MNMKRPSPRLTKKFLTSYFHSHLDDAYSYVGYLINKSCPDQVAFLKALYWLDQHNYRLENGDIVGEILVDGETTSVGMLPAIVKRLRSSKDKS